MKNNKTIEIILIIALITVILTLGIIMLMKVFNGKGEKENNIQQGEGTIENQNINQGISENTVNTKVETAQFIENLKKYYTGSKVSSVKLSKMNKNGEEIEFTKNTKGLDYSKDNIEITSNNIKASITDTMTYEWSYKIDDNGATFVVKKDNPTEFDKIVLAGNVNHISTIFVAYTELLGTDSKEALAFFSLATRDINRNKISDNKTTMDNEIFSTTEEILDNNSYSFTLRIKNNNIKDLQRLLEIEKNKESTTKFIGY